MQPEQRCCDKLRERKHEMQIDFHYYATYCAAFLAGYSHEECLAICYSAQFTDCCTRTLLSTIGGPSEAATTQLQLEMMDARTDILGLQDITRIWSSFHFLPRDLKADPGKGSRIYKAKYRLICGPNGDLLMKTVNLAKESLQAVGIAMHVLADTWAHQYFAGTPSQVINNTDYWFFELLPAEASGDSANSGDSRESGDAKRAFTERRITFRHNPTGKDDLDKGIYTSTVYQLEENSVMSLGHGRAGHLPDYSFMRYKYLPAWGKYEEVVKDNPSDYYKAFCQMVYALRYLRGDHETFETDRYDTEKVSPYETEIKEILEKRQLDACADWKAFGEKLSGCEIPDFDADRYCTEYKQASVDDKDATFLGSYIDAALAQKTMVTNQIFQSDNLLAGYSVEYNESRFLGIRDFIHYVENKKKKGKA